MKTIPTLLCFFLLYTSFTNAQKYYTLAAGSWNNTTNVWSLNGITPCSCFPGNNLSTDTIIINHTINLTSNLNINTQSKMTINSTGSLTNSSFGLTLSNATVVAYGSINISSLTINSGGVFNIYNSSLLVKSGMDINGTFTADNSTVTLIQGNINVNSTGQMSLINDANVQFSAGNLKNDGNMNVDLSSSICFNTGNITNNASASFTGNGAIMTSNGTIKNYGVWAPTLVYCSSGSDVGMTGTEDCVQANEMCEFTTLPTKLVYLIGTVEGKNKKLNWRTASETLSDYYIVERSIDGDNWTTVANVAASEASADITDYAYTDVEHTKGLQYYKLTLIDKNGNKTFSEVIALMSEMEEEMIIYPNPATDIVNILFKGNHTFTTINLYDAYGRLLAEYPIEKAAHLSIDLPQQEGLYFLEAKGETSSQKMPVMKTN